jgi:integrase
MPKWDLNLVLQTLCKPPFEPLVEASAQHLSLKTAFLIAWGTASRVSELHALCMDDDHLQWGKDGKWVDLTAATAFMAKNQRATQPPRRFRLQALEQDPVTGREELLCPVRALRAYLDHTKATRGEHTKIFLSFKKGNATSGVSSQTLARWLRDTIKCCYELSGPGAVGEAQGAHAHQLRALASSLAVAHHKPVKDVMSAAYWSSETCFSTFYLKDMAKYLSRPATGVTTFAAGFSLDI